MAHTYRESRNIERSIIDYLTSELLKDGWNGVKVEKVFSSITDKTLPAILVQEISKVLETKEIGNTIKRKISLVLIRIFARDDGERLDLANWTEDKLVSGLPYNEYGVKSGQFSDIVENGRINVLRFSSNRKELENIEGLSVKDRYRHLLGVEVQVANL